ncbi:hypothetical protein MNBD_GAMMA19-1545 [hydrothermal vent metagenome]|uniref:Uncharacterized protein n=1 Tax=hydrothermal vent metagenome TaxID=652676 RepID=A0A3B1B1Q6_9ZZZZ
MNIIFSVAGEGEEGGTASLVPPYVYNQACRVEQAKRFHLALTQLRWVGDI